MELSRAGPLTFMAQRTISNPSGFQDYCEKEER
jgi:hypothetical protein